MKDAKELEKLFKAGHHCISIVTHEEEDALAAVSDAALAVNRKMLLWSTGYGVRDGMLANQPAEPQTDTAAPGLCHLAKECNNVVCVTLDLTQHLEDKLTLRILRDVLKQVRKNNGILVMIDGADKLPPVIKSYCKSYELSLPDEEELNDIVRRKLREIHRKTPIEIGISKHGLQAMIKNLRGLTRRQAAELVHDTVADDRRFDDEDINLVLAGKRKMVAADGLLDYVQTPLTLDEIGGMDNLKRWLKHRQNAFKDEARDYGIRPPRGILMLGVQGAGKSLCAKAIATAWHQPLLRMDPSALFSKYIGESEGHLRKALRQTELMSPVILWIDEIEKAFASAAAQSSDGGLSKRMFGTLLTWMQEHEEPVFLVATANDIEALPPELMRKGRFDEIFFVGLPKKAARKKIFAIHLKKRRQEPGAFDVDLLAERAHGFSGAEIEQAVVSALHESFDNKKPLTTEMISEAIDNTSPLSVTMREKIDALCQWAQDRCVPAD
jgi:AAA+ superfamily predicted ATPase